jgi:hypothetical protein
MLYSETITVCSEIHTNYLKAVCGQNGEFFCVKPGGKYIDHWDFRAINSHHKALSHVGRVRHNSRWKYGNTNICLAIYTRHVIEFTVYPSSVSQAEITQVLGSFCTYAKQIHV